MAQIAYDNSTTASGSGTSTTFSHTCTGSNGLLVVAVNMDGDKVTGITYNGVAMTFINKRTRTTSNYVYLYYLLGPATGSNSVVISHSSGNSLAVAMSYTNVKQSAQPDSSNTNSNGGGAALTTATTVVADNSWVIGCASNDSEVPASFSVQQRGAISIFQAGDSNGGVAAGSSQLTATSTPNSVGGQQMCVASFAPHPDDSFTAAKLTLTAAMIAPLIAIGTSYVATKLSMIGSMIAPVITLNPWTNQTKNSATLSNQSKNATSFTNQQKS